MNQKPFLSARYCIPPNHSRVLVRTDDKAREIGSHSAVTYSILKRARCRSAEFAESWQEVTNSRGKQIA